MRLTADELLARRVFSRGADKPFGDLSAGEVAERADELAAGAGLGHASRVAAVALAWRELARTMADHGAGRVGELDRKAISDLAERLWIAPPGGSLLP
jgi:hypothetical protein